MKLDKVFRAFFPVSEPFFTEPFGSGHIHETFLISIPTKNKQFIFQKINQNIFTEVNLLQENILNVTDYIGKKFPEMKNQSLQIIKTSDGNSFFRHENGECWRCFHFIQKSKTFNQISDPALAFEAGKALGSFLRQLQSFPVGKLHITLPDFHSLDFRFSQFDKSIETDKVGRKDEILREIVFAKSRAEVFFSFLEKINLNDVPLRVTHNDPKINNILFDEQNKAICLIDLDTVMPGYVYHDFGDAIRTGTASAPEDETDNSKMFIQMDLFEAYSKGFLSETKFFLTETEISILAVAPQIMTFIIGLRFLTDYVNGDVYFKIHHSKHNFQRWLAQKALLLSMEAKKMEMKQIIQKISNNLK